MQPTQPPPLPGQTPGRQTPPRRWGPIAGIGCGGLLALFVFFWVVGTIAGPPPERPERAASSASPTSSSPAPTAAPPTPSPSRPSTPPAAQPSTPPPASTPSPTGRRTAPHPTAAQQQVYLARVRLIDPALAAKPERDIRRARGICDRILNPPGGSISLVDYTIYMLSGPDVQLTEPQAERVITAVKAWCR